MKKIIISSTFGVLVAVWVLSVAFYDTRAQLVKLQIEHKLLKERSESQKKDLDIYSTAFLMLMTECSQGNDFKLPDGRYRCYRQQDM